VAENKNSVEELLRSLRKSMEPKSSDIRTESDNVLDLGMPIHQDGSAEAFVIRAVEKSVDEFLARNEHLIIDIVSNSEELKKILIKCVEEYLKQNLERVVKAEIDIKLAAISKSE
jgi:hypothetical protein